MFTAKRTRKSSSVRKPAKPGFSCTSFRSPGDDVDAIDVVELPLAAVVDADEDLVGEPLADSVDLGRDLLDRRQVLDLARVEVDRIDVIVFVAVFVLRVEDVLARVGPRIAERMPRCLSNVTGLALAGSSSGLTQTFSTPSTGATNASRLPSGLRRACAFRGCRRTSRAESAASRRRAFASAGLVMVLAASLSSWR